MQHMSYSLKQAAEATGKDKSTIQRAIKSGKISAFINDMGSYEIDPSELHRVFSPVACNIPDSIALQQLATPLQQNATDATDDIIGENRELKARVELLREMVDDLRRLLDEESGERKKLTTLLTYQPPIQQNKDATPIFGNKTRVLLWLAIAITGFATVLNLIQALHL
jgi:hypothetical protein